MPGATQRAWSRLSTHVVVGLCVLALLIGALDTATTRAATQLGNQISSSRRGQSYFESAMLSADASVAGIKSQMRVTKRALKYANRAIIGSKRAHWNVSAIVRQRSARLAMLEARYAGAPPEAIPGGFPDRLRAVRREVARAKAHRQAVGRHYRTAIRWRIARQHRLAVLKRSLGAAVARRESAEGGLGAYIVQLTRLAAERAEIQSNVQLSVSGPGFTWPSVGRISQTYGCTGVPYEPPRGSCRHFHDGLDIVSGYGSRVHTAADGVVAYAGWNPWDEQGRAWIMVVSHPNGYVTRYGHLIPGGLARVGQFVRQGEAIGKMGSTGYSTGTHLHFELLQGSSSLDPFAYLPAGMVTIKPAKHAKHGQHKHGGRKHGGRDARGHARGGHRRSGPDAAALDPMPAGVIISADGQLLGVDLGSADRRDTVGASPVMCPTSAQASGGIGQRAGRDTGHRLRSKGPRGGRDGRHHAGRDARTRTGARDDACVPALITDSPGDPGTGLAIAAPDRIRAGGGRPGAAEDSAGLIVRGRARRALPDDGMTGERDGGVRLPRLGTSPTPG